MINTIDSRSNVFPTKFHSTNHKNILKIKEKKLTFNAVILHLSLNSCRNSIWRDLMSQLTF